MDWWTGCLYSCVMYWGGWEAGGDVRGRGWIVGWIV